MSNEVANKKNAELSTDVMDLINESTGEGTVFDSSELQIPFIRLIQAMSPQLSKKKTEYIEGASQGDAFNTVTKERWDGETGLTVIVCVQTTKYLEFVPRESGGGFHPSRLKIADGVCTNGATFAGIFMNCDGSDVEISGNKLFCASTYGITCRGAGSRLRVHDNQISGPTTRLHKTSFTWADAVIKGRELSGSATWDPPSIAVDATTTTDITVSGAALGHTVTASISAAVGGWIITAAVIATDTVRVYAQNKTGGTYDLGSLTARVLLTEVV